MMLNKSMGGAVLLLLLLAVGFMSHDYLAAVVSAGHWIGKGNLVQDYVVALCWALLLAVSILAWPVPSRHKPYLLILWAAKIFMALGFMLIYEDHYPLDATAYYAAAVSPMFNINGLTLGSGTANVTYLVWLHQHLIPDSYHAAKISCAMIGLWAIYGFYRSAIIFTQEDNPRLLLVLGLFPSILFWSTILGKDPIVLLGISLYTLGTAGLYQYRKPRYLCALAAGIYLSMLIRLWLGPILLAPLVAFLLIGIRSPLLKILFVGVAIAAFLVAVNQFSTSFNLETTQDLLSQTDTYSKSWAHGGSAQQVDQSFTSIGSMLAFMPKGAFAALFRPLPGEILNPFALLASFENLYLLVLLGLSWRRTRLRELKEPPVLWAILFVVLWAAVYGFVSYQNLGSAARFKLQVMPVFLCVLLYLSRRRPAPS